MSKRDIIDQIRRLNSTAEVEFLSRFGEEELLAYLHQLQELEAEGRLQTNPEPVAVG